MKLIDRDLRTLLCGLGPLLLLACTDCPPAEPSVATPPPTAEVEPEAPARPAELQAEPERLCPRLAEHPEELFWQFTEPGQGHNFPMHIQVRHEEPAVLMELLDLRPGMVVADVGAGGGFYTTKLARAVGPSGRVHSLDVAAGFDAFIRERVAQDAELAALDNISYRVTAGDDIGLPPSSVDLVLAAHLDFYMYRPLCQDYRSHVASIAQALEPGGRLVVVQWMHPPEGSQLSACASSGNIVANLTEQGLRLERLLPLPQPPHQGPAPGASGDVVGVVPTDFPTVYAEFVRP